MLLLQEQAPAWKVNAQQQRTAKDKEEREKETARQKEQEQEEKEKQEAEEKSRTSSNASSHKDEPVIVNGSVETTTAESANDEKEVRTPVCHQGYFGGGGGGGWWVGYCSGIISGHSHFLN